MHMRDLTRQVQLTESRNFAAGGCGVVQKGVLRVEVNKIIQTSVSPVPSLPPDRPLYSPEVASQVVVKFPRVRDTGTVNSEEIQKQLKRWYREIKAAQCVAHPNVLQVLGYCDNPDERFKELVGIVLPYCSNGNAIAYVRKYAQVDRLRILCCSVAAIFALHEFSPPVVHGDIKGSNILIDSDGKALLADFGTSRICGVKGFTTQTIMGSLRWMATELLEVDGEEPARTTPESDIWAFAMTILELLTGKPPFADVISDIPIPYIIMVKKGRPKRPAGSRISDAIWTLIESCWLENPNARPDARHVGLVLDLIYGKAVVGNDASTVSNILSGTWDAIVPPNEVQERVFNTTPLPYGCKWLHCPRSFPTIAECIEHECSEFEGRRSVGPNMTC